MSLEPRARRLVQLSTAVVLGRWETVRALRASAPAGEPDRAWREAVLQTHLFAGFPRLVEAYEVLAGCGGLGAPDADELAPEAEADVRSRGRTLFDRIYGSGADRVRARLAEHRPDFAAWIEGHAYGRVLSRPGLDAATRELCAVGALAALGQERQLASHARGALRCGAARDELDDALRELEGLLEAEALERARRVLERWLDGPPSNGGASSA